MVLALCGMPTPLALYPDFLTRPTCPFQRHLKKLWSKKPLGSLGWSPASKMIAWVQHTLGFPWGPVATPNQLS